MTWDEIIDTIWQAKLSLIDAHLGTRDEDTEKTLRAMQVARKHIDHCIDALDQKRTEG